MGKRAKPTRPPSELIDVSERCLEWPFHDSVAPIEGYVDRSNRWTVMVFPVPSVLGTPWEGMLRVGIRCVPMPTEPDNPVEILMTWSQIQAIKNQLWPDQIAIEVFPPADQLVDVAPMRWLWVFPKGVRLPFSLSSLEALIS